MSTNQQNYYDVLNLQQNATQADIKKAFRKLAKRYHPDTNPGRQKAAAKRLKEIIAAYKVLGNARERARYDMLLETSNSGSGEGGASAEAAVNTLVARAEKLLEDLLNGAGPKALKQFDEMRKDPDFSLAELLNVRDYLDCVFLLAEQLERAGRNREAAELYEELYEREKEPPRHRYFFEEVKIRLKKLYSRKLPREATTPEEEIRCYKRILEFDVDRSEKAFILKKIAEVYLKIGKTDEAKRIFRSALDLKPGLKGTATIREQLGLQ
jgi:curved DNA-binding protein CbpA